jgi:dipeptidase E
MGGNTFHLNYYAQKSGFGDVIKNLLLEGLVYGGESAGAILVGSTLHGIEYLDDPKLAPEILWNGIGLLDYGLIPHWGWEKYGEYISKARNEMEKHGTVITLDNDKALVIIDGQTKVVHNLLTED